MTPSRQLAFYYRHRAEVLRKRRERRYALGVCKPWKKGGPGRPPINFPTVFCEQVAEIQADALYHAAEIARIGAASKTFAGAQARRKRATGAKAEKDTASGCPEPMRNQGDACAAPTASTTKANLFPAEAKRR